MDITVKKGGLKNSLILSLKRFFGRYQHFFEKYSVGCVQMTNDGIGNSILVLSCLDSTAMSYDGILSNI